MTCAYIVYCAAMSVAVKVTDHIMYMYTYVILILKRLIQWLYSILSGWKK